MSKVPDYAELKDNWDSYGSKAINKKAVRALQHILDQLRTEEPHFVPTLGGGVQAEWTDIEIEAHPDGSIEVWCG